MAATFVAAVAVTAALSAGLSAVAEAKAEALAKVEQDFRGPRGRRPAPVIEETKADYDGRFVFMRLRYGAADLRMMRREPPWAHDYPRADFHFMKILSELTLTRTFLDQGNIRTLDDPDMAMFPLAYMSEPGFWTMSEAEAAGLRSYLQKGGFIIFDDFRDPGRFGGGGLDNLRYNLQRAIPGAELVPMDLRHPIFHCFFEIDSFDIVPQAYDSFVRPSFLGLFEDNNPNKRLLAIVNYNTDISDFWEFSGRGFYPVDDANEAFKLGVNYMIYGLTH